jgi:hypothetical protein
LTDLSSEFRGLLADYGAVVPAKELHISIHGDIVNNTFAFTF